MDLDFINGLSSIKERVVSLLVPDSEAGVAALLLFGGAGIMVLVLILVDNAGARKRAKQAEEASETAYKKQQAIKVDGEALLKALQKSKPLKSKNLVSRSKTSGKGKKKNQKRKKSSK